ncbi:MAG: hypothetical protein ACRDG3_06355 [Tepidiformaceae bacterium]
MTELPGLELAANWTSAAGALEGVLSYLGAPLPRHAIMGLSGHAWHTCLGTRGDVSALPSGPSDLDWEAMVRRYARTGIGWERFGGDLPESGDWGEMRSAAVEWAIAHLDAGRPLVGWDFHLHEFGIVYGYDRAKAGFLVHDILSGEVGSLALWADWPSAVGRIELFAPAGPVEVDAVEVVGGALDTAIAAFQGLDGPADGQPRGTAALVAWAEAMESEAEIDRPGNAYTLAVAQGARMDGANFLADVAASLPGLAAPLREAERAVREEVKALAPLITLFPFPTGGHGNVSNAGLRRGAAMALHRAAAHERKAATAIAEALALFESD